MAFLRVGRWGIRFVEPPQFASSINRNKTQNSRKPKGLLLSPPGGITTELTRELWIFDHFFEQGVASLHEGSVSCLGLSVAQRNASHNPHNLACFFDQLVRVPFHKSHFLKRNRKVLWHFRVVLVVFVCVVVGRFWPCRAWNSIAIKEVRGTQPFKFPFGSEFKVLHFFVCIFLLTNSPCNQCQSIV